MTYVMSDIHGNSKRFDSVMEQIKLQLEDTLYILGDVIDRYSDGIRILRRIMKMPNVKMLLGNHEYMMLEALQEQKDILENAEGDVGKLLGYKYEYCMYIRGQSPKIYQWYRNGGEVTHQYLKHIRKELRKEICDYLSTLPLNLDVEVGGKKYKLVHASPIENYIPMKDHYNSPTEYAVWKRWKTCYGVPEGYTLIFGHTPTCYFHEDESLRIWYGENAIGMDCGCGYPEGRLACLRLEDGKEFYSEEECETQ